MSRGDGLLLETTAFAAMAWMDADGFAVETEKAMKYILGKCESGRFGSTQSTILALMAIT
jgi:hypothetical protein